MQNNILTKIDREILRLDPEFASRRQLKDLVWARSSIQSAKPQTSEKRGLLASLLLSLKELLNSLANKESQSSKAIRPKLDQPSREPKVGSPRPPRYFSKGVHAEKRIASIPYLLTETHEISKARPVPGNTLFLRSLAKGKGTLQQNEQGLIYLEIDNRFALSLIPYLKAFGLEKPPYFHMFGVPDGAHIPVIPPQEASFHFIDKIEAVGKEFSFEIEGLYSLEPTLWPEVEQVWFFKVRSPELEALRQQQFLMPRPGGHSFHIAVAVKPRLTKMRQPLPLPLMRINIAFIAA